MAVIVKQEEDNEVPVEVLAKAITKISEGVYAWTEAGMRREALVVLLVAKTHVCKRDVERVLQGIAELKMTYCLPPKSPTKTK